MMHKMGQKTGPEIGVKFVFIYFPALNLYWSKRLSFAHTANPMVMSDWQQHHFLSAIDKNKILNGKWYVILKVSTNYDKYYLPF